MNYLAVRPDLVGGGVWNGAHRPPPPPPAFCGIPTASPKGIFCLLSALLARPLRASPLSPTAAAAIAPAALMARPRQDRRHARGGRDRVPRSRTYQRGRGRASPAALRIGREGCGFGPGAPRRRAPAGRAGSPTTGPPSRGSTRRG